MVIIKKEALSYFYTKGEHRKNLVTKVSVIALRSRHRVTLVKLTAHENKTPIGKFVFIVRYLELSASKCLWNI